MRLFYAVSLARVCSFGKPGQVLTSGGLLGLRGTCDLACLVVLARSLFIVFASLPLWVAGRPRRAVPQVAKAGPRAHSLIPLFP